MSHILLIEKKANNAIFVKETIRVNRKFLDYFEIESGERSFINTMEDYKKIFGRVPVIQLINWIEIRFKVEEKHGFVPKFKYEIEPREFAKNKVLPKLKTWYKDSEIMIF